jgi:hypothetical protein
MKETRRLLIEIGRASGQSEYSCGSHLGKSELPFLQIAAILAVHHDCIIRFTRKKSIQPRLSQASMVCSAIIRSALGGLLFQAIFVVQPTENRRRCDAVPGGKHVPRDAGRNLDLEWLRDARP